MLRKFLPVMAIALAISSPALARDRDHHDNGRHNGQRYHRELPRREKVVIIQPRPIVRPAPIISFNWGSPYFTTRYPGGYPSAYAGSYYREPVSVPVRWDYYGRPIAWEWR